MTPAATPEALVESFRQQLAGSAVYRDGVPLHRLEQLADALIAGPLAPILAALATATAEAASLRAEVDEAQVEVTTLRDRIDLMHIERGELVRKNTALRDAAEASAEEHAREIASFNWWQNKAAENASKLTQERAETAQLRAEVEAKDRVIAALTEAMEPFARFGNLATPDTAETWAGTYHNLRISTRFNHEDFRAARTALARAATAGEGRSDG